MDNEIGTRVLIAEDDYLVSETIKSILHRIGYTIVGKAVDGQEAIEMTQSTQPDVVLMDIEMPGIGGIEATRRIQEVCPTPVVILTAYETADLVGEASDAGAGAYLVKPPDINQLKRAITISVARFDDMMALRERNQQLQAAVAKLQDTQQKIIQQERLAAVGQLAAGIAHDYNNIMASIILNADILLRSANLQTTEREQLTTILDQGRRAADLTQQILDFSRKAMLRRKTVNLVDLLEQTVAHLSQTLPNHIALHINCDHKEIMVDTDPDRMQQVVTNLTLNARDAMPQGGDLTFDLTCLHLDLATTPPIEELTSGNWASLTITDTGTGIEADVLPHIFEPFFTTRPPQGSGLGLPQAYGIIKQHGGQIDVQTKVGEGTSFTIYLPLISEQRIDISPIEEIPEGDGETILVLEGDPPVLEALTQSIEMLNYRVLPAANHQKALKLLNESADQIALALIEISRSETDGESIRQTFEENAPAVPIMFLSDYHSPKEENWRGKNIVGWLKKPVAMERLAQVIAQTLEDFPR